MTEIIEYNLLKYDKEDGLKLFIIKTGQFEKKTEEIKEIIQSENVNVSVIININDNKISANFNYIVINDKNEIITNEIIFSEKFYKIDDYTYFLLDDKIKNNINKQLYNDIFYKNFIDITNSNIIDTWGEKILCFLIKFFQKDINVKKSIRELVDIYNINSIHEHIDINNLDSLLLRKMVTDYCVNEYNIDSKKIFKNNKDENFKEYFDTNYKSVDDKDNNNNNNNRDQYIDINDFNNYYNKDGNYANLIAIFAIIILFKINIVIYTSMTNQKTKKQTISRSIYSYPIKEGENIKYKTIELAYIPSHYMSVEPFSSLKNYNSTDSIDYLLNNTYKKVKKNDDIINELSNNITDKNYEDIKKHITTLREQDEKYRLKNTIVYNDSRVRSHYYNIGTRGANELQRYLFDRKRILVNVAGDGNCFFHAVLRQLYLLKIQQDKQQESITE